MSLDEQLFAQYAAAALNGLNACSLNIKDYEKAGGAPSIAADHADRMLKLHRQRFPIKDVISTHSWLPLSIGHSDGMKHRDISDVFTTERIALDIPKPRWREQLGYNEQPSFYDLYLMLCDEGNPMPQWVLNLFQSPHINNYEKLTAYNCLADMMLMDRRIVDVTCDYLPEAFDHKTAPGGSGFWERMAVAIALPPQHPDERHKGDLTATVL